MQKEVFSKLPKAVIFAADVGGTNTNIGLCSVKGNKVTLHAKFTFHSQKLSKFEDAIKQVLKESKFNISVACIAAAGPVSADRKTCKLTNVKWKIDVRKLPFKCLLLNDFEALGYSVNVLQPKDVKVVRKGSSNKQPIAILGAGTGLGKSLLYCCNDIYIPQPSEGGHADLPMTADEEPLFNWFGNKVEYEDVLSGRGIANLYRFFYWSWYHEMRKKDPAAIMKDKFHISKLTRDTFIQFYARCAKNFALDGLTTGGVIIAGGIAAKNPHLFGKDFIKEFTKSKTQRHILEKIPIKVITNYDVSLLGAAFAALHARV